MKVENDQQVAAIIKKFNDGIKPTESELLAINFVQGLAVFMMKTCKGMEFGANYKSASRELVFISIINCAFKLSFTIAFESGTQPRCSWGEGTNKVHHNFSEIQLNNPPHWYNFVLGEYKKDSQKQA